VLRWRSPEDDGIRLEAAGDAATTAASDRRPLPLPAAAAAAWMIRILQAGFMLTTRRTEMTRHPFQSSNEATTPLDR